MRITKLKFELWKKLWFLSIGVIIILAFSAGCGCSAKTYEIKNNFDFSSFSLSKLMIMNIEDGNNVLDNPSDKSQESQSKYNTLISNAKILPEAIAINYNYHSNKKFFKGTTKLPIASDKNIIISKENIALLRKTWRHMFVAASAKNDPNYNPKKPYSNIYFSRFLKFYDYFSDVTTKLNAENSKGIKPDKKYHVYKHIGNFIFGDYSNKMPGKDAKTPYKFTKSEANKENPPYKIGTVKFYPIDVTIAVNYKHPENTQSQIPKGSEMDITMQFIVNTDIIVKIGKTVTKYYQLTPNEQYHDLLNNLKAENELNNSPVIHDYYENILQFEDITGINVK